MSEFTIRPMRADEWDEVSELVRISTNHWYEAHARGAIFTGPAEATRLFCEVYEALDPGCCVVAQDGETGRLAGSCFYRQRETHVSLGIMNAHPYFFGRGAASQLLAFITDYADQQGLPIRLVSSAINLDSFSLYNRAGFVARMAFQDMFIESPADDLAAGVSGADRVRQATADDIPAMVALEDELVGIRREKDYRFFIENAMGIWHTLVLEGKGGGLDGFLGSVAHPGSNLLGPGVMRDESTAAALIAAQLDHHKGRTPVFLAPVQAAELVQTLYDWGARNCELHFAQIRGAFRRPAGIIMPTFMPETG
jgi:ribosomal protein S18 acetylase RimI-like enzyme